jgi:hypothetical protein
MSSCIAPQGRSKAVSNPAGIEAHTPARAVSEAAIDATDSIFHIFTGDGDGPSAQVRCKIGAAHNAVAELLTGVCHIWEVNNSDAAAGRAEDGQVSSA